MTEEVKKRRASPSQAKAVWEAMDNPSARRVAAALELQDYTISWRSIARWKSNGWAENASVREAYGKARGIKKALKEQVAQLPVREKAVVEGGMAVALASPPNPEEVADIDQEMKALIGDLAGVSLPEIQERTRMALNVVLMRRAAAKAELLVLIPKDIAAFVVSMTDAAKSLLTVPAASVAPEDGKNGHMIDVTPYNPLSDAIAQFKRRTGVAA